MNQFFNSFKKKEIGILLYIVVILCFIQISISQAQRFKVITREDKLSNSSIIDMVQDKTGFIWFSTMSGLNRFDGYEMKVYKSGGNDKRSILKDYLNLLYVDYYGNIWMSYEHGAFSVYNPENDCFTHFETDSQKQSVGTVSCFLCDSSYNVWIATNKVLLRYNYSKKQLETHLRSGKHTGKVFSDIAQDQYGALWLATSNSRLPGSGVILYNPQTKKIRKIHHSPTDSMSLSSNNVTNVFIDSSNEIWISTERFGINLVRGYNGKKSDFDQIYFERYLQFSEESHPHYWHSNAKTYFEANNSDLWIGTSRGVVRLRKDDRKKIKFQYYLDKYSPNTNNQLNIPHIRQDNNGDIWIGSDNTNLGLLKYDKQTDGFVQIKKHPQNQLVLGNKEIKSLLIGDNNVLWAAIKLVGAICLDIEQKAFHNLLHIKNNKNSLSSNQIFGIETDKQNNLWIGTINGLNKINLTNDKISHFFSDGSPTGLNQNSIFTVRNAPNNKLWLGYFQSQLSLFNPVNGKNYPYRYKPDEPYSLNGWSIREIIEDSDKNVWIATGHGVMHYNPELKRFYTPQQYRRGLQNTPIGLILTIYLDNKHNLWIGSRHSGLYKYNIKDTSVISYLPSEKPDSISDTHVTCIQSADDQTFWIGTYKGINRFDMQSNKFTTYNTNNGLCDNNIKGILIDKQGKVWMSTNNGISAFNPENKQFNNFFKEDGIACNEYNVTGWHKSANGTLYFGGINGLTYFDPIDIKHNPYPAKVALTQLEILNRHIKVGDTINNQVILKKSINHTDTLILNHRNNFFSIKFVGLHFAAPTKIKYKYILENFDKQWISINNERRYITYTNLPWGDYTLLIKASNNDGLWSNNVKRIHIQILPPWWDTILFRIGIVVAIILAIIALVFFRTFQLRLQKKFLTKQVKEKTHELLDANNKLQKINDMKSKFFINISHEFKTPLTLIMGPVEKLLQDTALNKKFSYANQQLKLIQKSSRRLLSLINQLLEIRKIETGLKKIYLQEANITDFTGEIIELFTALARTKQIELTFRSEPEKIIIYFDPDIMEKIFYNLISNAIKYTPEQGKIDVEISLNQTEPSDGSKSNNTKSYNLLILIRDTGKGIAKEQLDNIFDRFYNIDVERTSQLSSGIGLSYVKDLTSLLNGKVWVESMKECGTSFFIEIPVQQNPEDKQSDEEIILENYPFSYSKHYIKNDISYENEYTNNKTPDYKSTNNILIDKLIESEKKSILIVDDNEDLRCYLRTELGKNFTISEAANGKEGLQIAQKIKPDIVISDIMMPVMDGIAYCNELKSNAITSHIPVILLTAKTSEDSQLNGLQIGADDYIAKPFNTNLLVAKIESIITNREKLIKHFQNSDTTIIPDNYTPVDQNFLQKAISVVNENMENPDFDNQAFIKAMGMSRTHLYNKLKILTGETVSDFIRNIRLKKALKLIKETDFTISEIIYKVGFTSASYFTRVFKTKYGKTPKQFK